MASATHSKPLIHIDYIDNFLLDSHWMGEVARKVGNMKDPDSRSIGSHNIIFDASELEVRDWEVMTDFFDIGPAFLDECNPDYIKAIEGLVVRGYLRVIPIREFGYSMGWQYSDPNDAVSMLYEEEGMVVVLNV